MRTRPRVNEHQVSSGTGSSSFDLGLLHERFEHHAGRSPERIAVRFNGGDLTYGELDRRANWLAKRLRNLGVAPGVLVGFCADRSPDMVVGILGILKAGGAYLPIDPTYPAQRQAFLLEDSKTPI